VYGAAEVAPAAGLAIAAEEDADEPAVSATSYDLSRLASQTQLLSRKIWHTVGTLAAEMTVSIQ